MFRVTIECDHCGSKNVTLYSSLWHEVVGECQDCDQHHVLASEGEHFQQR